MEDNYLTYAKATVFLAGLGVPIAENTLRRMVMQRRIPFTKLDKRVLFRASALRGYLDARAVEPEGAR